jgi:hypothetical protein
MEMKIDVLKDVCKLITFGDEMASYLDDMRGNAPNTETEAMLDRWDGIVDKIKVELERLGIDIV